MLRYLRNYLASLAALIGLACWTQQWTAVLFGIVILTPLYVAVCWAERGER